jgi:hypothetical protein
MKRKIRVALWGMVLFPLCFAKGGTVTGRVTAPGGASHLIRFSVRIVMAGGQVYYPPVSISKEYYGTEGYVDYFFEDLPQLYYLVIANAQIVNWNAPGTPRSYHPWSETYYVSSTRSGTLLYVAGSDTAADVNITLRPDAFVQIGSNPPGCPFEVWDAGIFTTYDAAKIFEWTEGTYYTITASPYSDNSDGGRFFFREWNMGGGDRRLEYWAPEGKFMELADTVIARYDFKYHLTTASPHGLPTGEGWHAAWEKAYISVEDTIVEIIPPDAGLAAAMVRADTDSVRFVFKGWTGTGNGSYTGTDNPAVVTMNSNIAESADWKIQFPLATLANDPARGRVLTSSPGSWLDKDSPVTIRAVPESGYEFAQWDGDAYGTDAVLSLVMDTSKTVIARFVRGSHPPVLSVPDTSFAEDDTLFISYVLISSWISDPVDPVDLQWLTPSVTADSVQHIRMTFGEEGLFFWPDPEWNGKGWFVARITDPRGDFDEDTVRYAVTPVEDPPERFALISPLSGTVSVDSSGSLEFRWHRSLDPDIPNGDAVRYELYLGSAEGVPDMIAAVEDTVYTLTDAGRLAGGRYKWKVRAVDLTGESAWCMLEPAFQVRIRSGAERGADLPVEYRLSQNYPNPFNPATDLSYALPERARVRIEVFTADGRKIRTLVNEEKPAGEYSTAWNGSDETGRKAVSGVYLCRMTAGSFVRTIKMTVMK